MIPDDWSCDYQSAPHFLQGMVPTHQSYIEQEQRFRVGSANENSSILTVSSHRGIKLIYQLLF